MTEQEVRALVREAIARHMGHAAPGLSAGGLPARQAASVSPGLVRHHASHALFVLSADAEGDGPCLIEPAVSCTHCGYCKSYGH